MRSLRSFETTGISGGEKGSAYARDAGIFSSISVPQSSPLQTAARKSSAFAHAVQAVVASSPVCLQNLGVRGYRVTPAGIYWQVLATFSACSTAILGSRASSATVSPSSPSRSGASSTWPSRPKVRFHVLVRHRRVTPMP